MSGVFDRALAMLLRLSPPWPDTSEDTSVGKELGSIAAVMTAPVERLDDLWAELFPDTADETIDRWEQICRIPINTSDDIDVRRARVLGVLRRAAGPRLDQLKDMLAAPLAVDSGDLVGMEQLRQYIETALTLTDTTDRVLSSTPTEVGFKKPWPGLVDDWGVAVYLDLSALNAPTVTLTHEATGTEWTIDVTAAAGWYYARDEFLGLHPGSRWTLTLVDADGATLQECRLLVSNDVDSAQIYNLFIYRDPDLPGAPDIDAAQRSLDHTVLAQMFARVVQRQAFIVGDPLSLCGREPIGA